MTTEVEHYQVIICNRFAALENSDSDVDTMIFPWADSRVKMWFSDISGINSIPKSRCAGGLVEPKLMTRCRTLCCVCLRSARRRVECDPCGWWKESEGHCTWPGLSVASCGECFSKLITGCLV